ncbi:MAG TPA: OsmC family protein [Gaiellaceae bacterium]|nr:OsmC family protein [Gaiellaceae bacterium]
MAAKPRVLEFDVSIDDDRSSRSALGGTAIAREDAWWPEHLVLAALVRCTLASMDHSARKAGLDVVGSGRAHGTVTKRAADGLYAFVDIRSELEIELDPAPVREIVAELVEKAERGCFVSNSLTTAPRHHWTVNGEEVGS